MTWMKLMEAIELMKSPLLENYSPEDTLPEDGLYWYLLQPREEHDDQRKRAYISIFRSGFRKLV